MNIEFLVKDINTDIIRNNEIIKIIFNLKKIMENKDPKNKFPKIKKIDGVDFSVCKAHIKKNNELDLLLIKLDPKSVVVGTTTLSKTCSYAVEWCKKNIKKKQNNNYPIILINSGNANVFTGEKEKSTVNEIVNSIVNNFNTTENNIFIASIGVIGEILIIKK